jgi:Domain of unknown function (DUF4129)
VVIGLGLVLAVAATIGPLPPAGSQPGGSLSVRLPDPVRTTVFALLALSVLLLLGLQRPRRPAEDEPAPMAPPPPRRQAWVAALISIMPMALLAAAWYFIATREEDNPIVVVISTLTGLMDLIASARKPPTSVPLFDYTVAALALLFALGIFALLLLVSLAGPLETWWARRTAAPAGPAPAAPLIEDVGDLRRVPDARAAVIRAYGRFEHAAADARAPRAPWQTPGEFRRVVVARLPLPAPPVDRLTSLFEIARYSARPVDAAARDAACDCLDEIIAALEPTDAR